MAVRPLTNDTSFKQVGPPQWTPDGFDLDKMVLVYQGATTELTAFMVTKPLWQASPIDGNMFLSNYATNEGPNISTVKLIYTGKRNGTLPPAQTSFGTALQSASITGDAGSAGNYTITIIYVARTASVNRIVSAPSNSSAGLIAPVSTADPQILDIRIQIGKSSGATTSPISSLVSGALAYFDRIVASTSMSCEEVVAGRYWRLSYTSAFMLFPKY